jgi:outer membrane lipoprotein carrier protein
MDMENGRRATGDERAKRRERAVSRLGSPVCLVFAAIMFLLSTASHAGPARDRLEAFTQGLDSLRGTFVQEVRDPEGRVVDTSSGSIALQAPRLFRFEYTQPFPQLIVADGDDVWIYDQDLAQVTVRSQSQEEAHSPLTVLIDMGQLDREYKVNESGSKDGLQWMTLTPKGKDASFKSCELGFASDGPSKMVVVDQIGQRNEWRFAKWERNPKLDPKLFQFTPPKGADVIGKPGKKAEAFPIR